MDLFNPKSTAVVNEMEVCTMQNNMHSQVQTTSNVDLNIENCSLGDSSEEI